MRVTVSEASRCGPRPWGSTITRCPVPHNQTSGSPSTARKCAGAGGARGRRWCSATARRGRRRSGRRIADALRADHTVYLWDMLGYGTSTMADGQDVSLAAQGALFADLLGYWELAEPHVVAHDYGGAVALRAHLLHGARYRSLALVDVVALAPWGSEFFRLVGAHADVFAQLPPPLHEALVRAYIAGAAHRPLRAEDLDMLTAPWLGDRRPGGVLPPDRPGRPALHRRDRAAVPDARPARAGGVGHRGHLDPGRPRAPARRADPRRPARPRARRGAPHPARRPRAPHGRAGAVVEKRLRDGSWRGRLRSRGCLGRAEREPWGWRRCSPSAAATSWSSWTSPS